MNFNAELSFVFMVSITDFYPHSKWHRLPLLRRHRHLLLLHLHHHYMRGTSRPHVHTRRRKLSLVRNVKVEAVKVVEEVMVVEAMEEVARYRARGTMFQKKRSTIFTTCVLTNATMNKFVRRDSAQTLAWRCISAPMAK